MAQSSRIRQIGWFLVLGTCLAGLLALTFKVNAVKSDVRLVERQIIAAEHSKLMLETEFQTRASQQQLADWNAVEFGYAAPRADQYVEHERQLAVLGTPRGIGAPKPIRVAMNRPIEDDPGLLDEWLENDDEVEVAQAETTVQPERIASSLAQRLAQPASVSIAAAEIGQ